MFAWLGSKLGPGARDGQRFREADGTEVAVLIRGDAVEVYFGKGRGKYYALSLSPGTAVGIARLILRWWARDAWYGLRNWLWNRALSRYVGKRTPHGRRKAASQGLPRRA